MKTHKAPRGTVFFTRGDRVNVLRRGKEVEVHWDVLLQAAGHVELIDAITRTKANQGSLQLSDGKRTIEVPADDVKDYVHAESVPRQLPWPPTAQKSLPEKLES